MHFNEVIVNNKTHYQLRGNYHQTCHQITFSFVTFKINQLLYKLDSFLTLPYAFFF